MPGRYRTGAAESGEELHRDRLEDEGVWFLAARRSQLAKNGTLGAPARGRGDDLEAREPPVAPVTEKTFAGVGGEAEPRRP